MPRQRSSALTLSNVPSIRELCDELGFQGASSRERSGFIEAAHSWRKTFTTASGISGADLTEWNVASVQQDLTTMANRFLDGGFGERFWSHSKWWSSAVDLQYPDDKDRIAGLLKQLFWKQNKYALNNLTYGDKSNKTNKVAPKASHQTQEKSTTVQEVLPSIERDPPISSMSPLSTLSGVSEAGKESEQVPLSTTQQKITNNINPRGQETQHPRPENMPVTSFTHDLRDIPTMTREQISSVPTAAQSLKRSGDLNEISEGIGFDNDHQSKKKRTGLTRPKPLHKNPGLRTRISERRKNLKFSREQMAALCEVDKDSDEEMALIQRLFDEDMQNPEYAKSAAAKTSAVPFAIMSTPQLDPSVSQSSPPSSLRPEPQPLEPAATATAMKSPPNPTFVAPPAIVSPGPASSTPINAPPVSKPKPQINCVFYIITSPEPNYSDKRWPNGRFHGKSLAVVMEEISEATRKDNIERLRVKLQTPYAQTETIVEKEEEDVWEITKMNIKARIKDACERHPDHRPRLQIWIEPFYGDQPSSADEELADAQYDV